MLPHFALMTIKRPLCQTFSRPFHKWEVEVEVLADNSLKCAHHFCCGQEPCLPFSFMVLLQLTR